MRSRPGPPAAQLHSVFLPGRALAPNGRSAAPRGVLVGSSPKSTPSANLDERQGALARLEAVLTLAREPLTSRKLSQYANLADATAARTLIRHLNERYDRRGRAFRIVEVAGGYQLLTRPQLAAWLRRLQHTPSEVRLSAPALETLAVIAYRQPVGRADIEAIRGVNCGEIIRQLMDRDLVRIGGRSPDLGRPYLYATTRTFLQIFGLSSLEDLPRAEIVRQTAIPAPARPDNDSRVSTTDNIDVSEEESDVTVTTLSALTLAEEKLERKRRAALPHAPTVKNEDEEDDFDDDDEEDDDEDDVDDEEDDELDDEEEDELDEEEDDEDFDDDLEEEEWEEVDDDEEDLDDEDDEEDDDDDDWDDDDDDEEEDWEEEAE
jgi:segregation and condensation protein B